VRSAGAAGTTMMTRTRTMTLTVTPFTRITIGMMMKSSVCRGTGVIAGFVGARKCSRCECLPRHSLLSVLPRCKGEHECFSRSPATSRVCLFCFDSLAILP
jgi:hypothetical protein